MAKDSLAERTREKSKMKSKMKRPVWTAPIATTEISLLIPSLSYSCTWNCSHRSNLLFVWQSLAMTSYLRLFTFLSSPFLSCHWQQDYFFHSLSLAFFGVLSCSLLFFSSLCSNDHFCYLLACLTTCLYGADLRLCWQAASAPPIGASDSEASFVRSAATGPVCLPF